MACGKGRMVSRAMLACALGASLAQAEVREPWVATDRTVDCSSYETIMAGVITPGMTEEQKAIALFAFYLQRVYHYQNIAESRHPLKCLNAIGNTLCGSQATCMKGLLNAAGLQARVVSHPGHTFYEAFYGGAWHGFDTMTTFYVFTRGEKRHVASFEELNKDPSLIKDAVKEGRAVPGLCCCGDDPMAFAARIQVLNYEPQKSDWSVKDYALRPGEEIVRSWWPLGKPLPGTHRGQDPGPLHTCGARDSKNSPELFKFWEPYGIPKFGPVGVSYRHYFNGWMSYSPDLGQPPLKDALARGELAIPVRCPFYITAATATFEATCPSNGDSIEVSVAVDGKWTPILTAKEAGKKEYRAALDKAVVRPNQGRHAYELKLKLSGKAALHRFHLKTLFTHNAMAAPHLMPGQNKVTVTVANPEALKATPITLVYCYKEAPNWTDEKAIEKTASESPFAFAVELPQTAKLPQMQDLTLRCGTLRWVPQRAALPNKVLCDFSKPEGLKDWKADSEIALSHDGAGMLMAVSKKAAYPQASLAVKEDWTSYQSVVIELENLGPKAQSLVFRVRSNESNDERTDVDQSIPPGKSTLRIPVAGLRKTRLAAVTKVYLMTLNVPDDGCKVRVRTIYLEPHQDL